MSFVTVMLGVMVLASVRMDDKAMLAFFLLGFAYSLGLDEVERRRRR